MTVAGLFAEAVHVDVVIGFGLASFAQGFCLAWVLRRRGSQPIFKLTVASMSLLLVACEAAVLMSSLPFGASLADMLLQALGGFVRLSANRLLGLGDFANMLFVLDYGLSAVPWFIVMQKCSLSLASTGSTDFATELLLRHFHSVWMLFALLMLLLVERLHVVYHEGPDSCVVPVAATVADEIPSDDCQAIESDQDTYEDELSDRYSDAVDARTLQSRLDAILHHKLGACGGAAQPIPCSVSEGNRMQNIATEPGRSQPGAGVQIPQVLGCTAQRSSRLRQACAASKVTTSL